MIQDLVDVAGVLYKGVSINWQGRQFLRPGRQIDRFVLSPKREDFWTRRLSMVQGLSFTSSIFRLSFSRRLITTKLDSYA